MAPPRHGGWAGVLRLMLLWLALLPVGAALAIDNPDAPDRTGQFLARAQPLEAQVSDASGGIALARATGAYAKFLDAELNRAYTQLLAKLDEPARRALVQSQRQWLLFRDAELHFIGSNWTPENFGSSSALSRGGYAAALVKQRVVTLLGYLQNYP